jgi:SOS-response transcriptional repressor LexA
MSRNILPILGFFRNFMDWIKILEMAEETIQKQGIDKTKLPSILGVNSQYLTDIRTKKKKSPGPEFVLSLITKLNFNPVWLSSGEGPIFNPPMPDKHPLIMEFEALIDQRLEEFEARISGVKSKIRIDSVQTSESGMFVSEPEPEYRVESEYITYVEGLSAGKPIFQSEARSTIPVPKRYIKSKPEDYYVGRIKGTSMIAAGIPDGVLVLIRYSDVPRDGAIQVVERQGEATLKRMREIPGVGWKICFDDHTGRYIEVGPEDEFYIQGDFVAVLPENLSLS